MDALQLLSPYLEDSPIPDESPLNHLYQEFLTSRTSSVVNPIMISPTPPIAPIKPPIKPLFIIPKLPAARSLQDCERVFQHAKSVRKIFQRVWSIREHYRTPYDRARRDRFKKVLVEVQQDFAEATVNLERAKRHTRLEKIRQERVDLEI